LQLLQTASVIFCADTASKKTEHFEKIGRGFLRADLGRSVSRPPKPAGAVKKSGDRERNFCHLFESGGVYYIAERKFPRAKGTQKN
jgi:hypothetical protein